MQSSVSFTCFLPSAAPCLRPMTRSSPFTSFLLHLPSFLSSNARRGTGTHFRGSPRTLAASRRVGSSRRSFESSKLSAPKSRDSLTYARARARAQVRTIVFRRPFVLAERGSDNARTADREARSRTPRVYGTQARRRARRDASTRQSASVGRALVPLRRRTARHRAHARADAALGWEVSTFS